MAYFTLHIVRGDTNRIRIFRDRATALATIGLREMITGSTGYQRVGAAQSTPK
jgi:hypothetical protein